MDLSIIIVNYRTKALLEQCLNSLVYYLKYTTMMVEIIIVNNDTDALEEIKRFNVTVVPNENKGYGDGCNKGARNSSGNILLFINPDIVLKYNIFESIERFIISKHYDLIGFHLSNKKYAFSFGIYPEHKNILVVLSGIEKICNYLNLYFRGFYFAGAALCIVRSKYFRINGFDSSFFMYYDEIDLQKRLKEIGIRYKYIRNSKIVHYEATSIESWKTRYIYHWQACRYYHKKHHLSFRRYLRNQIIKIRIKMAIMALWPLSREKEIWHYNYLKNIYTTEC